VEDLEVDAVSIMEADAPSVAEADAGPG